MGGPANRCRLQYETSWSNWRKKSTFERAWVECDPIQRGKPRLIRWKKSQADSEPFATGQLDGCEIHQPKTERRAHPWSFRLDMKIGDSTGAAKRIISPLIKKEWNEERCRAEQMLWRDAVRAPRT